MEREHLRAVAPDGTVHTLQPQPPQPYEWLSSDNRAQLTSPFLPANGTERARAPLFVSFDGRNGFDIVYWKQHPDVPATIRQRDERPAMLNSCWPLMCLGWQLPIDTRDLSACLTLPQARVRGWSDVEGLQCLEVDVPNVTQRGNVVGFLRCWLDPDVAWLPRRWIIFPMRWHNELPAEGSRQQLEAGELCHIGEVLTYVPVTNRLSGEEMQFPGETRSDGAHCQIDAASVRWNPVLDIALFRPDMTAGAKLEVHRGVQVVKAEVLGSEADRARHQQFQTEAAESAKARQTASKPTTPAATGPVAIATPQKSRLWYLLIVLSSLSLLLAGCVAWIYRKASTP